MKIHLRNLDTPVLSRYERAVAGEVCTFRRERDFNLPFLTAEHKGTSNVALIVHAKIQISRNDAVLCFVMHYLLSLDIPIEGSVDEIIT